MNRVTDAERQQRDLARAVFLLAVFAGDEAPERRHFDAVIDRAAVVLPGIWDGLHDMGRQYLARQCGVSMGGWFSMPEWRDVPADERARLIERAAQLAAIAKPIAFPDGRRRAA